MAVSNNDQDDHVLDGDQFSFEDELSEDESVEGAVQYPWPCPNNWPLMPGDIPQETSEPTPASPPYIAARPRSIDSEEISPTKNEISHTHEIYSETKSLQHPHDHSMVKLQKDGAKWETRVKVVQLESPEKAEKTTRFTDPFDDDRGSHDSIHELPNHTYKTTARSFTSTTSSRRRDRISFLETFNRRQSGVPVERKLFFPATFTSRRITAPILKPWKDEKDPRRRLISIIPLIGIVLGLAIGAYFAYQGYAGVPKHNFCQILHEDWSQGINPDLWTREVQLGGFGTGEFEWATDSDVNSFVKDGRLHIHPTLTSDTLGKEAVLNGYTIDLTADGTCTGTAAVDCVVTSNFSTSKILPPAQSARLVSKGKFSMKYGKVEVRARMPRGDWLWPAIWMLPEDDVYGPWPLSGEIDIAEGRGNDIAYKAGGRNLISTTLHWGPSSILDAFFRTSNGNTQFHSDYTHDFFTFGLEWTDKYLYTYVNNQLRQVFYIKFDQPFFMRGQWPAIDTTNKTAIANPWAAAQNNAAPFDQAFYLILNVAVGTSHGYFPDGVGNKPWVDGTATSRADFYSAVDSWYPTWGKGDYRDMVVESVKAWEIC